jgi:hypothetical protein
MNPLRGLKNVLTSGPAACGGEIHLNREEDGIASHFKARLCSKILGDMAVNEAPSCFDIVHGFLAISSADTIGQRGMLILPA